MTIELSKNVINAIANEVVKKMQEPCDDAISRQAAIEVLRNRWLKTRNYDGIGEDIAGECEIYLKTLPSAQPKRKAGRWIDGVVENSIKGISLPIQTCSECKTFYPLAFTGGGTHFCPNCGADMRGEK